MNCDKPLLKNRALSIFFCIFLPAAVFAGGSGSFSLDLKTEALTLGTGTLVNLGALYFTSAAAAPDGEPSGFAAWPSFSYNGTLDDISTVLSVAGIASFPFLLDRFDSKEVLTLGTMYLETFLLTWGNERSSERSFPEVSSVYGIHRYASESPG